MSSWVEQGKPGHWTYTGDPSSSDRDAVRFKVGDTDDQDGLVADEEIDHLLTAEGSVTSAAAAVCEHLARRFARFASKSVSAPGGFSASVSYDQRSRAYADLAVKLREEAGRVATFAYAGGISLADKETLDNDTDRLPPFVTEDQFINQ